MVGGLQAEFERRRQRQNQLDQQKRLALQLYNGQIGRDMAAGVRNTPLNWITLECLANEKAYAKSDTQKGFILWEAVRHGDIHIEIGQNVQTEHRWMVNLFAPGRTVRFPFNTGDSNAAQSLSWDSVRANLRKPGGRFFVMPRWSTASRSSVALVPRNIVELAELQGFPGSDARQEMAVLVEVAINEQEWIDLHTSLNNVRDSTRFAHVVGDPGQATGSGGKQFGRGVSRLYSIKTGVHYVGSKYEGPPVANKHLLEANSTMAMLRSNCIRGLANNDETLGVQAELLTITAPLARGGQRDGFQVRDLSCMQQNLKYLPGQAIPYARSHFDHMGVAADQVDYWRRNFAIPLGRAKGRLFLNYGLIHTSANAQNFVLGFLMLGVGQLRQFVIRDLGDTSWHDDFIRDYISHATNGGLVWRAMRSESQSQVRHVLHTTSSGQYPAPHIIRLAVFSVLTHRFGDNLGWSRKQQWEFATGVFDGFKDYLNRVLRLDAIYPTNPAPDNFQVGDIVTIGREAAYPFMGQDNTYRNQIDRLMQETPGQLLHKAAWVRNRITGIGNLSNNQLFQGIHAEEALLCCAIEKKFQSGNDQFRKYMRERLSRAFQGNWPSVVSQY